MPYNMNQEELDRKWKATIEQINRENEAARKKHKRSLIIEITTTLLIGLVVFAAAYYLLSNLKT